MVIFRFNFKDNATIRRWFSLFLISNVANIPQITLSIYLLSDFFIRNCLSAKLEYGSTYLVEKGG
jgi:hypothetical protein